MTVGFWDVRPLGEDFDYYCVELLKRKDPLPLHDSHYDKIGKGRKLLLAS